MKPTWNKLLELIDLLTQPVPVFLSGLALQDLMEKCTYQIDVLFDIDLELVHENGHVMPVLDLDTINGLWPWTRCGVEAYNEDYELWQALQFNSEFWREHGTRIERPVSYNPEWASNWDSHHATWHGDTLGNAAITRLQNKIQAQKLQVCATPDRRNDHAAKIHGRVLAVTEMGDQNAPGNTIKEGT